MLDAGHEVTGMSPAGLHEHGAWYGVPGVALIVVTDPSYCSTKLDRVGQQTTSFEKATWPYQGGG